MLTSVSLSFTETSDIVVKAGGVVIFVGPNNSGKSLVLKEVEGLFTSNQPPTGLQIVSDYEVAPIKKEAVEAIIAEAEIKRPSNLPTGQVQFSRISPGGAREVANVFAQQLLQEQNLSNKHYLAHNLYRWGVARLDGRSRFNLTNDQPSGDLLAPAGNVLVHLFQDDDVREKIRDTVHASLGVYLTIDPTNGGQLRIKLSPEAPGPDEQSLNKVAREYYKNATYIRDASDGVQAFVGIMMAVFSGDYHLILVDEPEAFLHPPLARQLGKHLAGLAQEKGGTLMASTHSADFLMGCVQATSSVQIVRLEYSAGKSKGRIIDPAELKSFFKRPLMRSANVISGLFYDGVIVTESDNDRAFYQEIYSRLSESEPGYPSVLFVNAQNKQTMKEMVGPLRSFGVPAAAVPDIDILKDGGSVWTDWLKAVRIPEALHLGLGQQREAIKKCFVDQGVDMKSAGINGLTADCRLAAQEFFDSIQQYGIFPVRDGELETWLKSLGVPGKKTEWTVAMLERLGADPQHRDYVRPAEGDVWHFLRKVRSWIQDAGRKGMPPARAEAG